MYVKVLFFGVLKDVAGRPEESLDIPPDATMRSVFDYYAARLPRLRQMAGSIVMAKNREFTGLSTGVAEGDEIAFLPPVSGGAGSCLEIVENGHYFALTRSPIDTRRV